MLAQLRSLWRSLRHRSQFESDLDAEMQAHIESRAEDLVRSGLPRAESLRRARLEFGCAEAYQDRVRESRRIHWFEEAAQDIRFAVRLLRKTPAITVVALLSLALGIGANTAIFSLIDAIMLRSLPVQNPGQLIQIEIQQPGAPRPDDTYTNPIWEQLRDHQNVLAGMLAWSSQDLDLANGAHTEKVRGEYVSGDYFRTLGVQPAAGRLLTTEDDVRGCSGAAVISYGFWQSHYAGAESAIGSTLDLSSHDFPIVGVLAPGFSGLEVGAKSDIMLPICTEAIFDGTRSMLDHRSAWWLQVMGRLKPGSSVRQATTGLNVLAPQVFAATLPPHWKPESQRDYLRWTFVATRGATGVSFLRRTYEKPLEILMFIVGLVLLIACANIASLMTARAASRREEIAIRLSIGASRARLIRQVLTESLVLSAAGALLGIFFAQWGSRLLVRFVSSARNKVFLDLSMDGRVLAFTVAAAVLTGLLFGVLPAVGATRVSLTSAIRGDDFRGGRASRFHSGRWVVALQVALSLILLVGTGLFVRSFWKLTSLDPGFDRGNVLLVETNIRDAHIPPNSRVPVYTQMLDRLKSLSGVLSASQSFRTPIQGLTWNEDLLIEGFKPRKGIDESVYFNWITPEYFSVLRTPILRGRNFDARDSGTAPHVAIVNETMARHFFPGQDALGRYFRIDEPEDDLVSRAPVQIIGIVKDAKYQSLREKTFASAYVPLAQLSQVTEWSSFELRTTVDPAAASVAARDAIAGVTKAASVEVTTLREQVSQSLAQDRMLATLSAFFGILALVLTSIGLYGVMAYIVTQRTHEIGIRMALGAQPRAVLRLVVSDVTVLLAVGIAAGAFGALWITRLVQQLLYDLKPDDPVAIGFAIIVLVAAGLLAAFIPARRAMRVDPMIALRHE
ncbi:MAG TPA: ABC transporter permease [Candidatus Limnocylindrales bacterium]|nr:ABC transporter permease [Candidatus Limnocylindrales bacterium]